MSGKLVKNTLYLTVASVGQKIIAFVYFLFLARIMEPEKTGMYTLALSISLIFSVIADFGITPVAIREIAKDPRDAVLKVRTALGSKLPFMLIAVVLTITATILLEYDPVIFELVLIATLVLLLDTVHIFFYGVLRGIQRLQYEAFGMFFGMFTTATLGGLVLAFSPSLHLLLYALLAGSILNAVIATSNAVRTLGTEILRPVFDKEKTMALLRIAFPFALAAIFVKVFSYVDSIFISKMIDTTAVGLYSIAYKFTYAFQFLPLAFTAALYPGFSELVAKDKTALAHMFMKAMWYMMLLATPIVLGLWAVADEVVLLAGDQYQASGLVLQYLVIVLFPIFLDFPIGSLLNAANRQVTKTTIVGITMLINVVLNVLLIPEVGILGAAYAAIASFSFMFVAGLYYTHQILEGFSLTQLAKKLAPIFLSGLVMLSVVLVLKPIIGWVGVIPVGAAVYLLALVLTRSLKKEEFVFIQSLVRR